MTAKQKAIELVESYYQFDVIRAKDYALIAVDEILKLSILSGGWQKGIELPLNEGQRPYWIEVKQEIKNL